MRIFSNYSMAFAVARDHNRNFYTRAWMYFELLGYNMELWVRLFSRDSMAFAVAGGGHELFMRRALELHKNLKDRVGTDYIKKFVSIMSNGSIVSRLKEEDEDFSNLICEWMPRMKFSTHLDGLEPYSVEPLGANFFKFVTSPEVWWKRKHSAELRTLLEEPGRVTPDNLEGILRGICKPAPTSTSTPVLVSSTTTTTTTRSSSSSSTHTVRSSKTLPSSPTRPSKMARTQSAAMSLPARTRSLPARTRSLPALSPPVFVRENLNNIPEKGNLQSRFDEQIIKLFSGVWGEGRGRGIAYIHSSMKGGKDIERGWWVD